MKPNLKKNFGEMGFYIAHGMHFTGVLPATKFSAVANHLPIT
jgi:hypothetical protein